MADDDADDYALVKEIVSTLPGVHLEWIPDGVRLMDYLYRRAEYVTAIRPDLIFLDLNMPLKSGREVMQELKSNPYFRRIPIVILSTSDDSQNVLDCYERGANSYMVKPSSFSQLERAISVAVNYWENAAQLPAG